MDNPSGWRIDGLPAVLDWEAILGLGDSWLSYPGLGGTILVAGGLIAYYLSWIGGQSL